MRRSFFFILGIFLFFSLSSVFSIDGLYLEYTHTCKEIPINFTLFNNTEFVEDSERFRKNLCNVSQSYENDSCFEFQDVAADVYIYDGPVKGLGLLYEIELTGEEDSIFEVKFDEFKKYLIEVKPKNDSAFEKLTEFYYSLDCDETYTNYLLDKRFNSTFLYDDVIFSVEGSNSTLKDDFVVSDVDFVNDDSLYVLNQTIRVFAFNYSNSSVNFSKSYLEVPVLKGKSSFRVYKFDNAFKKWSLYSGYNLVDSYLKFTDIDVGVYSILDLDIIPIIEEDLIENESFGGEDSKKDDENKVIVIDSNNNSVLSGNNFNYVVYVVVFLILVVVAWLFMKNNHSDEDIESFKQSNEKLSKEHKFDEKKDSPKIKDEVLLNAPLHSYRSVYDQTLEYVQNYKGDFSRDILYRELKKSNIPLDIVNRVLDEEY